MKATKLMAMIQTDWKTYRANWDIDRKKLGPFVNGYIISALQHTTDTSFFGTGESLHLHYTKHDFTDRLLAQIIRESVSFYSRNHITLEALYENWDYAESEAGYDFWLSRNASTRGGFFDRGFDDEWDILQRSAKAFGPQVIYVTNEGEIDIETGYRWSDRDKDWYRSGSSV